MGNKQVKWNENTITRQKIQGYKVICLIPTVVKMRPYKKPDFVCAAPGQKGVGSVLRAGSQMFPPAGQVCCKMKQKRVVEDSGGLGRTHISLFASPAGVLVKSLDQAEHQPCHCSSPGSVTSCPSMETLAWPFPDVCQRFPEAAGQRKRGGREYNENWGNNNEKRKMSGNRPCAAVLAALW